MEREYSLSFTCFAVRHALLCNGGSMNKEYYVSSWLKEFSSSSVNRQSIKFWECVMFIKMVWLFWRDRGTLWNNEFRQ